MPRVPQWAACAGDLNLTVTRLCKNRCMLDPYNMKLRNKNCLEENRIFNLWTKYQFFLSKKL